jgi:phage terminase large subunit-like protein
MKRPRSIIDFVKQILRNPETGKPFELYPAQESFLRRAFMLTDDGRLPFVDMLYSTLKKSGKTMMAGWTGHYVGTVIGGPFAEVFVVANDYDQSTGRVFKAMTNLIESSPRLAASVKNYTRDRIDYTNGSFVQALANDYAGAAGGAPALVLFDEAWAYVSERSKRLVDELAVPVPTRKVSGRLVVSYAGFDGESDWLEGLCKRAVTGEQVEPDLYQGPGFLSYLTHSPCAPWQTEEWIEEMRRTLRPSAFTRQIENRFSSGESSFIEPEWWAECTDPHATPIIADRSLPVWIGVDASVKHDTTAVVAVTWDRVEKKARLVTHRIFEPSPDDPIDFEASIEATILSLRDRFYVRAVYFDPFQMVSTSQRLKKAGLRMVEFPQTVPNLTEASSNLYELVKARAIIAYPDDDIRRAMNHSVAHETSRGWRIAKDKTSSRIDVVVALAQAALGAVEQGNRSEPRVSSLVWG